jgi:hypothetical protein
VRHWEYAGVRFEVTSIRRECQLSKRQKRFALGIVIDIIRKNLVINANTHLDSWGRLIRTRSGRGFAVVVRQFDEEGEDAGCIKMRMPAIYEAEETMEQGVTARDSPPS